jgi:ABC-type uncharacterized transport system substrate-binding protein
MEDPGIEGENRRELVRAWLGAPWAGPSSPRCCHRWQRAIPGTVTLFAPATGLSFAHRKRIVEFAARSRLPALYAFPASVMDGELMSFGPNLPSISRMAAPCVDKILRGQRPGDLLSSSPHVPS